MPVIVNFILVVRPPGSWSQPEVVVQIRGSSTIGFPPNGFDELQSFSTEEFFDLFPPKDREMAMDKFRDFLAGKELEEN